MKRIEWLDNLKGFGMLLVILGHVNPGVRLERLIYTVHIPLFLFASGILYRKKEESFLAFMKRKSHRILLPFLFWDVLAFFYDILRNQPWKITLKRALFYEGKTPWDATIWFLLALFMVVLLHEALMRLGVKNEWILVLSAVVGAILNERGRFHLMVHVIPVCLVFYTLGIALRGYLLAARGRKRDVVVMAAAFAVTYWFGVVKNGRVSYTSGEFYHYGYFLIAAGAGVLGISLFFRDCGLFQRQTILSVIGRNSLFSCVFNIGSCGSSVSFR